MAGFEDHVGNFSLKAYPGDFKTLLAFNFGSKAAAKNLAGFTVKYTIPDGSRFYLWNSLVYEHPDPKAKTLIFKTSDVAGKRPVTNATFTFADEYAWLGFTARRLIFDLLADVEGKPSLKLDVFAYDLTEPDFIGALQRMAAVKGKLRIILDNATLHHADDGSEPEDQAAALIKAAGKGAEVIKRGHFARYAHDKVLLVRNDAGPIKVLTGSTNFAVNGIYVNSNHVLVYDDVEVASWYKGVFDTAWQNDVAAQPFIQSNWSTGTFTSTSNKLPKSVFHFSPHEKATADKILGDLVQRVKQEAAVPDGKASILFAVMALNQEKDVVYQCLNKIHETKGVFSYGISDAPKGVTLYPLGEDHGVLVTGKPGTTDLPAPFDQVPPIQEHQVHHKFVVCGFNRPDAVVYCGSSNLAEGGEHENGDNLIAINDSDVATAFAIEALALVDHFDFLDNYSKNAKAHGTPDKTMPAAKRAAAKSVHWYLGTTDAWAQKYFQQGDLHSLDRQLFGA